MLASWRKSKCPLYVCLAHAVSSDMRQSTAMPPPAGASLHQLKPSNFESSPLLNEMLVIIAEAFVRVQVVKNPIQGISIMISHDRDPLSSFHIY